MSNFERAFAEVIGFEGNYSNHPADKGGETKYGISKRAYPNVDIANLTLEGAKGLYWLDYWNKLTLALINDDDVACEIFEQAVNMGRTQAVLHLQRSLTLNRFPTTADGLMGPLTISRTNAAVSQGRKVPLLKCLNGFQFIRYLEIVENNPEQSVFFVGWLKRVGFAATPGVV